MIPTYLSSLNDAKRPDMQGLLQMVQTIFPNQQPTFFDGKNKEGMVTGYFIQFKKLPDLDQQVLKEIIEFGLR